MPITLDGTNGITTPTYGGADTSEYLVPVTAFKNRIINGDMRIDQRNAGASIVGGNNYGVDRFQTIVSQSSKYNVQQNAGSVTPPSGFTNYLGITSTSAYSVISSDYFAIRQFIEGFNIADLGWGTANAQTVTLSFWVRSSLTGTFGGALQNASQTRAYPYSYTISSANTWEYKTITIAGDTTGTWLTNNGQGIGLYFSLGTGSASLGTAGAWAASSALAPTGSVSVVGTNGATFYITGVQLEKGSTATSFDYRPYGTELALCQRYFEKSYDMGTVAGTATSVGINCSTMVGGTTNTNAIASFIPYKVSKRATPTMSVWDSAGNSGKATRDNFGVSEQTNVAAFTQNTGENTTQVYVNGGNAASGMRVHWTASAEL